MSEEKNLKKINPKRFKQVMKYASDVLEGKEKGIVLISQANGDELDTVIRVHDIGRADQLRTVAEAFEFDRKEIEILHLAGILSKLESLTK